MKTSENVKAFCSFEDMYSKCILKERSSRALVILSGVEAVPVNITQSSSMVENKPNKNAFVEKREVYHKDGWRSFDVYEMTNLVAGNIILGPAIIRDR